MAAATESVELAALLVAREYLYTLFHKLFGGETTPKLLAALESDATLDALEQYAEESPEVARAKSFITDLRAADQEALADACKDEYTRMFIGPDELVACPWEAPYTGTSRSVCQQSTLSVRLDYEKHGWQPRKLLRVPDDHVSLMCTFLARLASRSIETLEGRDAFALARGLRDQEAFVHRHLASWVDEYAHRARQCKTALLYPQLIELFADFVHLDEAFLAESAYWAEGLDALCAIDAHVGEELSEWRSNTLKLASLRLFGLEDNELVDAA